MVFKSIDFINMKDKGKDKAQPKSFTLLHTSECLKLDKTKVNFCKYPIFASSHKQLPILAELLDYFGDSQRRQFHLLKLAVKVHPFPNSHLYNLDKIFSVKAVENGEELQEMEVPMREGEPMTIFVRVNIPELEVSTDISGTLQLQVDDLSPLVLPIMSRGEVPQVICLKELEDKRSGTKIIKIPSKGTMKIPFKNLSNINFSFEVKIVGRDADKPDADGVRINVQNQLPPEDKSKNKDPSLRVDANSAFCVHLDLEMLRKDNPIRVARRILVLQVQGTRLLFPFPLEIIITN